MTGIRVGTLHDAPALAELQLRSSFSAYRHIFPPEAPTPTLDGLRSRWRSWLGAGGATAFVAEHGGDPVGVVLAGADPLQSSIGHLGRMYVAPERWGRGIGRALYSAATDHLSAAGYASATLWVLEANHRARAWYERLAWVATGERRTVFQPPAVDELRYKGDLAH